MARYDVSDTEWRLIASLLPNKPRGVARVDGPTDHQCDLLCFEDGLALARSTQSLRASTAIIATIAGQKLASGYGFFTCGAITRIPAPHRCLDHSRSPACSRWKKGARITPLAVLVED